MEELYQLSLALTTWLQASYPQLLGAMRFVSLLGEEQAFLVILPAFYWSINKRLGRQLGYIFLLSALINNIAKNFARQPRPFWLDPDVQKGEAEGYGLPSGHVQNVTAVYLLLAYWARRTWGWVLALLFVAVMGLSRFYLGVHFLQDIAVGCALGLRALGAFRGRARGVGGIFYDDLNTGDWAADFAFTQDVGRAFLPAFLPLAERHHAQPFTDADRDTQLIHRGLYAEYNLVYDRGTKFGLETGHNPDAVLMSLPPLAKWV